MSDVQTSAAAGPQATRPQAAFLEHGIRRAALRNPAAPVSLAHSPIRPLTNLDIEVLVEPLDGAAYEVVLRIKLESRRDKIPLFQLALDYYGLFELRNSPPARIELACHVDCAQVLFPEARRVLADVMAGAGLKPFFIDPVNFAFLYQPIDPTVPGARPQSPLPSPALPAVPEMPTPTPAKADEDAETEESTDTPPLVPAEPEPEPAAAEAEAVEEVAPVPAAAPSPDTIDWSLPDMTAADLADEIDWSPDDDIDWSLPDEPAATLAPSPASDAVAWSQPEAPQVQAPRAQAPRAQAPQAPPPPAAAATSSSEPEIDAEGLDWSLPDRQPPQLDPEGYYWALPGEQTPPPEIPRPEPPAPPPVLQAPPPPPPGVDWSEAEAEAEAPDDEPGEPDSEGVDWSLPGSSPGAGAVARAAIPTPALTDEVAWSLPEEAPARRR
jgi:preprotein translocase subunit SecB